MATSINFSPCWSHFNWLGKSQNWSDPEQTETYSQKPIRIQIDSKKRGQPIQRNPKNIKIDQTICKQISIGSFPNLHNFRLNKEILAELSPSDWNDTALRNFCHVKWHGFKKLAMSVDDQPVLRSSFKFSASHLFYDPIILFIKPYPTQIEALYCKYIKLFKGEETRMQDSRSRSVIADIVLFIYETSYWRWHP